MVHVRAAGILNLLPELPCSPHSSMQAIWEEMQGPVHAVDTMVLKAPSEVE